MLKFESHLWQREREGGRERERERERVDEKDNNLQFQLKMIFPLTNRGQSQVMSDRERRRMTPVSVTRC